MFLGHSGIKTLIAVVNELLTKPPIMTQRAKQQPTNDYKIDRHKFFDTEERRMLLEITSEMAQQDAVAGRITWVTRWMLIHLSLYSGLRVSEIAALTPAHLHLAGEYQ